MSYETRLDTSELNELGKAAVWYCENGFAIIPCKPRSKAPATQHGLNDWFDDPNDALKLWTQRPDLNIGIVCGTPSHGRFAIDIDVDEDRGKDGYATISEWEKLYGDLPETAIAITGSGGMHYIYKTERTNIRPSANAELGIDIRADGSYIVAPPSIHPNGRPYEWQDSPEDIPIATATSAVYDFLDHVQRNSGTDETRKENGKFRLPSAIGKGQRDNTLFKYAAHLRAIGRSDEEIANTVMGANFTLCDPPLDSRDVRRIVRSACRYEPGGSLPDEVEARILGKPGGATDIVLAKDKTGKPLQTTDNMICVMRNDGALLGHFWYNSMAYTRMVTCPLPWDPREGERTITDEDYIGLTAYMERTYGLMRKDRIVDAAQFVCKQNERNPIQEWLDSLEWDGERRVGSMITVLGAANDEYNRTVERLFMLGAVARAYEPGCKFELVPILLGKQGIGKSRYVALLARVPAWYDDNFNTIDGDAAIEKLRGVWIAELAELLATKRAKEVEAIKSFISSTADSIRPKYARETVQRLRVCVFIGTTNNSDFLMDSTGNRRFLPVECRAEVCNPWLFSDDAPKYVEQMWAEAVHVYKTEHPRLVLPDHLKPVADEIRDAHTEEHPIIPLVHDIAGRMLSKVSTPSYAGTIDERVCTRQVFDELPEDIRRMPNRYVMSEISKAMDSADGWVRLDKKARTNGYGTTRCWVPRRD